MSCSCQIAMSNLLQNLLARFSMMTAKNDAYCSSYHEINTKIKNIKLADFLNFR